MANKLYEETHIQNIANSIREKTGGYDTMTVSEMSAAIDSITDYNIHYGDTAPTDTTKLWLKTSTPSEVSVGSETTKTSTLTTLSATLPTGLHVMGTACVGNKVYLFGGKESNDTKTDAIRVYDTTTNTVSTLTVTLPDTRTQFAVVPIGTTIYILGGYTTTGLRDIHEFCTESETFIQWNQTLPNTWYDMAYAAYGNKIYLFGGVAGDALTNAIVEVDLDEGTITTLSSTLPSSTKWATATTIGDNIYIFGGNSAGVGIDTIQVFNPMTGGVKALDLTLPTILSVSAAESIDNKAYLFGGNNDELTSSIVEFDPYANTVSNLTVTLPTALQRVGAVKVNGMIYVFGGYSSSGSVNTIYRFGNVPSLASGEVYLDVDINAAYVGNSDGSVTPVEWEV